MYPLIQALRLAVYLLICRDDQATTLRAAVLAVASATLARRLFELGPELPWGATGERAIDAARTLATQVRAAGPSRPSTGDAVVIYLRDPDGDPPPPAGGRGGLRLPQGASPEARRLALRLAVALREAA